MERAHRAGDSTSAIRSTNFVIFFAAFCPDLLRMRAPEECIVLSAQVHLLLILSSTTTHHPEPMLQDICVIEAESRCLRDGSIS